jgi:23S rRNA pseudouridine1911/1915/1917 synthase
VRVADHQTIHIAGPLVGQTLAGLAKSIRADLSWNDARKLVQNRHVQVNGNLCLDPARKLTRGEVVRVWSFPQAKLPDASDVKILHVDEHLVVVDKPAGITTLRHAEEQDWPAKRKSLQPTLDEILAELLPSQMTGIKPSPADTRGQRGAHPIFGARPKLAKPHKPAPPQQFRARRITIRPVHRLDRDTSGVMLFALSVLAEQSLVEAFKHHRIERAYRAVVHGHPAEQTIDTHLVRNRGDGLRGSTTIDPPPTDAQRAITHIKPIETIGEYSMVECRLETGRTHQIRIHLSERGHMLCGEKMYRGPVDAPPTVDRSQAPRHALHAYAIGFTHPATGKPMRFTSDWPAELKQWLTRLRNGQHL